MKNMKKVIATMLVLILAVSLSTACGGNKTGRLKKVDVKPSELISLEDAENILEMSMKVIEGYLDKTEQDGFLLTEYISSGEEWTSLQIRIKQDASSLIETTKETCKNNADAVTVEEIGDWACITGTSDGMAKFLYIAYGDYYYIEIDLSGNVDNGGRSLEEDATWKLEKITEIGKLAVGRLEDMVK